MKLIDTHTHLFVKQFQPDLAATVARAVASGCHTMLLPNIDLESIEPLHSTCLQFTGTCLPMMGLHPCSVDAGFETALATIKHHLFEKKYVAVGEIGLDLYWDKTFASQQEQAFVTQCHWAAQLGLPVSIHTREATGRAIALLQHAAITGLRGVFHCFSGTLAEAMQAIELGFMLGIGGVLTYKNSGLPGLLRHISAEHLVLETDSPYLAPIPHRGKRNESAFLVHIAQTLAEVYNLPVQTLADITTANAIRMFKLSA